MNKLFVYIIAFVAVALCLGMLAAEYSPTMLMVAMVGVAVFILAFLNSEAALYILIFSMLLSPEFMAGATAGKELGRGVTLRLDDFLLLVIGLSWLARTAVHKDLGLFLRTPLNKPIFYYLTACVVSTGLGVMTGRASAKTGFFFVLKYFEYFLVYFMVVNHLETREQLNRLIHCLFLTCFIASVYGMLQIPGGGRVSAPFEGEIGEPNTFGGYLVFIGAVAMGIYLKIDDKKIKRLLILLIVSIIPSFLFTESRSSYLAAIPAGFFLVYTSERRLLLMLVMAVGLMIAPLFLPHSVKQRILFTFTQAEEKGQIKIGGVKLDTSTSARLDSWRDGVKDWVKRPIFGYGVTGYKFMDAQFPRVLVETGILGMWAFIYLLYSIYKLAMNNFKKLKMPLNQGLAIGFFAGYIGLLFHAIGANTFIIVRIMEPFWLMAGIIAVLPDVERAESQLAAGEMEPAG
jgi:O-antigen ligase